MSELKTLKDLEFLPPNTGLLGIRVELCVFSEYLRAEAIKWIQILEKQKKDVNPITAGGLSTQIIWIKHFFNLEDEPNKDYTTK